MARIFASGVFGSDYHLWGAWSFTDRGTRDKLSRVIADDDWCLAIGMTSPYTPLYERGRLIALLQIGHEAVDTRDLVEPDHWRRMMDEHGDGKWLHALPIRRVQRFVDGLDGLPRRRDVLPRIDRSNLYMQVGRYYLELEDAEAERVFALPRVEDSVIYGGNAASLFAAGLRKTRAGPPPSAGTRTLTAQSGPAATYLMRLEGHAEPQVTSDVRRHRDQVIWKIGFSNDPDRRLGELNAHLPSDATLRWSLAREQWHADEINAYALEQRILRLAEAAGLDRFKGEMVCALPAEIEAMWSNAMRSAHRPSGEVVVKAEG